MGGSVGTYCGPRLSSILGTCSETSKCSTSLANLSTASTAITALEETAETELFKISRMLANAPSYKWFIFKGLQIVLTRTSRCSVAQQTPPSPVMVGQFNGVPSCLSSL